MPSYKQIYTGLYPGNTQAEMLPDGRLRLVEPPQDGQILDLHASAPCDSVLIMADGDPFLGAITPDGRYRLAVELVKNQDQTEFWLVYADTILLRFQRRKLNTELQQPRGAAPHVAVTPGGRYFLANDAGVIRFYNTADFIETGAFQIAHPDTDNRLLALAASTDEQLVAGLSSWKNIVLYSVPERRIIFVRQIRDQLGWYDAGTAQIFFTPGAQLIITLGSSSTPGGEAICAVNAFRLVSSDSV